MKLPEAPGVICELTVRRNDCPPVFYGFLSEKGNIKADIT